MWLSGAKKKTLMVEDLGSGLGLVLGLGLGLSILARINGWDVNGLRLRVHVHE